QLITAEIIQRCLRVQPPASDIQAKRADADPLGVHGDRRGQLSPLNPDAAVTEGELMAQDSAVDRVILKRLYASLGLHLQGARSVRRRVEQAHQFVDRQVAAELDRSVFERRAGET